MSLIFWLAPIGVFLLRAHTLGLFSSGPPPIGDGASDFWGYVGLAKLAVDYGFTPAPGSIPWMFPASVSPWQFPELFFEWLTHFFLVALSLFSSDPIILIQMFFGIGLALHVFGCFWVLWRRFSSAPWGVIAAFLVLTLNPWSWSRLTLHWIFSFSPFFLALTLYALEASGLLAPIQTNSKSRAWKSVFWPAFHVFFLLGQSIYLTVFFLWLAMFWLVVLVLPRPHTYRGALKFGFGIVMGLSLSLSVTVLRLWSGFDPGTSVQSAQRDPSDLHTYSVRMREYMRGGEGSLWNKVFSPEKSSRDGEGVPATMPKLWILFMLLWVVVRWRGAHPTAVALLSGVAFFLLIGLQEIPWIRENVLFNIAPFIRSYARVTMPILVLIGILTALWWSQVKPPRAVILVCLALLIIDFGWPQTAFRYSRAPVPDQDLMRLAQDLQSPILYQASMLESDRPYRNGMREFALTGLTGLPLLTRPGNSLDGPLKPGSEACLFWRGWVLHALDRASHVLWWWEGNPSDFESTRRCLTTGAAPLNLETRFEDGGRPKSGLITRLTLLSRSGM